jgi:hypothetical protein
LPALKPSWGAKASIWAGVTAVDDVEGVAGVPAGAAAEDDAGGLVDRAVGVPLTVGVADGDGLAGWAG